jgi:hypothetical protein
MKIVVEMMPWWLDLVLLAGAVLLWVKGANTPDDVWSIFQKALAFAAVVIVLLGGRQILLEILALSITFWLPSAARFEDGSIDHQN